MPAPSQYTEQDRDTALQVWAFRARRKPTMTAAILEADYGIAVNPSTVSVWSTRYDWPAQAEELFKRIGPGMLEEIGFNLLQAAHSASGYVADVMEDRAEANRDKLRAAFDAIDRARPTPRVRDTETIVHRLAAGDPQATEDTSLHHLDDARLRELAAGTIDTD